MTRFEREAIRSLLVDYLPRAEWYVGGRELGRELKVIRVLEASRGFIATFRVGEYTYQLPMVCGNRKPSRTISKSRYVRHKSLYCVEAEYTKEYFELLDELGVEREEYLELSGEAVSAEPMSSSDFSVVALQRFSSGREAIVKGYRILREVQLEPVIYRELFERKFALAPALYRTYSHRVRGSKKYLSTIVERAPRGERASVVFYDELKGAARSLSKGISEKLEYLDVKMGRVAAKLHIELNSAREGLANFLGLERVSSKDVEAWIDRLKRKRKAALSELQRAAARSEGEERTNYEFWYGELGERFDAILDQASSVLERLFIDTFKGRTHQDLSPSRMICTFDNEGNIEKLVITDFEGEVLRTSNEIVAKEPLIRDVAALVAGIYYLAFDAYSELHNIEDPLRAARKVHGQKKASPIWKWTIKNSIRVIRSYLSATSIEVAGLDLFGYESRGCSLKSYYYLLLYPWIIDKALYDAVAELKRGRTRFAIPLTLALNPVFPYADLSQ